MLQSYTTDRFDAYKWLQTSANIFNAEIAAPKGQNQSLICNMKAKKVLGPEWHELLERALNVATEYAEIHIK